MTQERVGKKATSAGTAAPASLSRVEFLALMALLTATVAFSTDAMLPALPQIASELAPGSPNQVQLIVTSFIFGLGLGTFAVGPLSDALGRKRIVLAGSAIYVLGALVAWNAHSLEAMLAARMLQGIGAAGPRVLVMAIVRDLHSGEKMAKISSLIMTVFAIFPAFAPALGARITALAGWRAIFVAFVLFASARAIWLWIRQPETHPAERRSPLQLALLWSNTKTVLSTRAVVVSLIVQALCLGMLFATLSSIQQIFDVRYGLASTFHFWFAAIAVVASTGAVVNASLVERVGMKSMINAMLTTQLVLSGLSAGVLATGSLPSPAAFAVFLLWAFGIFFQGSLTLGNLNALAMQPMGNLAGLVASITGALGTVFAVLLAIPIGLAFNGTPLPLMTGTLILAVFALAAMRGMPDARGSRDEREMQPNAAVGTDPA